MQITSDERSDAALFNSRYTTLASNTIDYWMQPDDPTLTADRVTAAIETAPVVDDATLQIYVHVPFCAQRCRFCAFSGGNSLDLKSTQRYARLVVEQMEDLHRRTPARGLPIRSVNIGGGSPDLLGESIHDVLAAVRGLEGCTDETEISVEMTASTTKEPFIDALVRHGVTKAAFGIQSLDADVRGHMRQPRTLRHIEQLLEWIGGRIPIVNVDLITGLPGQDLAVADADLRTLMADSRINCISTYLLTPGAAPSLLAGVTSGAIPPMPSWAIQARMRLHSYTTLQRSGWVRRGTNSYFAPDRIDPEVLGKVAGNECIGASHYEAFLLAAGPQAISAMPGARVENQVDIESWCRAMERGETPYHLPKCSLVSQTDTALWVFPLRWEGLSQERFDRMVRGDSLSETQLATIDALCEEGLVVHTDAGFELSTLGEVFMGHLVRDLKKESGRAAVDAYIAEGARLGEAITGGVVADRNQINNRQISLPVSPGLS